jgi:Flp pilus assembly pilin Flp
MSQAVDTPTETGDRITPRASDESGQGMVEYAFILLLIAMVCIVMVQVLGHQTSNLYSNISSGLGA